MTVPQIPVITQAQSSDKSPSPASSFAIALQKSLTSVLSSDIPPISGVVSPRSYDVEALKNFVTALPDGPIRSTILLLLFALLFGFTSTSDNSMLYDILPLSPETCDRYLAAIESRLELATPYHPMPLVKGEVNICRSHPITSLPLFIQLLDLACSSIPTTHIDVLLEFLELLAATDALRYLTKGPIIHSLHLLRTVNGLSRRLSKVQHFTICGRLVSLTSQCFSVDERSGVNLLGTFNTANTTDIPTSTSSATDSTSSSSSSDAPTASTNSFHAQFWSLQQYLSDPASLMSPAVFLSFISALQAVFSELSSVPPSDAPTHAYPQGGLLTKQHQPQQQQQQQQQSSTSSSSSSSPSEPVAFPKYLTAPALFPLQLSSQDTRRTVLLQVLFVLKLVTTPAQARTAPAERLHTALGGISAEGTSMMDVCHRMTHACLDMLAKTSSTGGAAFAAFAQDLTLLREPLWQSWKKAKCPPLTKDPTQINAGNSHFSQASGETCDDVCVDETVIEMPSRACDKLLTSARDISRKMDGSDDFVGVKLRITPDNTASGSKTTLADPIIPWGSPNVMWMLGTDTSAAPEVSQIDGKDYSVVSAMEKLKEAAPAVTIAVEPVSEDRDGKTTSNNASSPSSRVSYRMRIPTAPMELVRRSTRPSPSLADVTEQYTALSDPSEDQALGFRLMRAGRSFATMQQLKACGGDPDILSGRKQSGGNATDGGSGAGTGASGGSGGGDGSDGATLTTPVSTPVPSAADPSTDAGVTVVAGAVAVDGDSTAAAAAAGGDGEGGVGADASGSTGAGAAGRRRDKHSTPKQDHDPSSSPHAFDDDTEGTEGTNADTRGGSGSGTGRRGGEDGEPMRKRRRTGRRGGRGGGKGGDSRGDD